MYLLDNGAKLPRSKAKKLSSNVQSACDAYAHFYKKLYKQTPTFEVTDYGFIRINGKPGVKLARLRTLTEQLKDRLTDAR